MRPSSTAGGPASHIGIFQKTIVERLKWISPQVFLELLALGQTLPGPTSTQVSFAIGVVKKGIPGGLLSGALFQYPGAIMMTALGAAANHGLANPTGAVQGMAYGFGAAGVAMVAGAAVQLGSKVCKDKVTQVLCLIGAIFAFYWPQPYTFPLVILFGGIVTWWTERDKVRPSPRPATRKRCAFCFRVPLPAFCMDAAGSSPEDRGGREAQGHEDRRADRGHPRRHVSKLLIGPVPRTAHRAAP